MICLIQYFEADFLWKVSLKILNSGIILKTFTHAPKHMLYTGKDKQTKTPISIQLLRPDSKECNVHVIR